MINNTQTHIKRCSYLHPTHIRVRRAGQLLHEIRLGHKRAHLCLRGVCRQELGGRAVVRACADSIADVERQRAHGAELRCARAS